MSRLAPALLALCLALPLGLLARGGGLLGCHATGRPPPAAAVSAKPGGAGEPAAPQPTLTRVPTADGAAVALLRYPAAGPPVILVHGVSSNHATWDLDASHSLARTLQARGYDAWLLDLRGHGLATLDARGRRQRAGGSLDDYGRLDLPAAIEHVRAVTGYDRVGYVGHSMGGMVAAIYTAWQGDAALAALVVVGSPVDFGQPDPLLQLAAAGTPLATLGPTLATPTLARMSAGLDRSPLFVDPFLFAPGSLTGPERKELYRTVVSPMSRGELRQLRDSLHSGHFASVDGSVDYLAALHQLYVPLLVIAGRGDHVAPVDRVAPFYEQAGSADKALVVAGRVNGFGHDYGHLDLALGDDAPREIHPRILAWLEGRWAAAPPGSQAGSATATASDDEQAQQAGQPGSIHAADP